MEAGLWAVRKYETETISDTIYKYLLDNFYMYDAENCNKSLIKANMPPFMTSRYNGFLAGLDLYGQPQVGHGALEGKKVFASDMTFDATVNPIVYEKAVER